MNYWLMKTEPGTYSWGQLEMDKKTSWDGVRNYQARNNMKSMQKGDLVLVYHSGEERSVMGIAKISKESYPEPENPDWVAVEVAFVKSLQKPVTLGRIKGLKLLNEMVLVKNSRLSVQPVKADEFDAVVLLSE